MSDSVIEQSPENAGDPGPAAPQQESPPEDTNLSAEAKSWRLKYQDASRTAADAVTQAAAVAERLRAAERQLVDQHIAARVVSTEDFWTRTQQADLLGDDGAVDLGKVDAHLAGILAASPHYAAAGPDVPLAAPVPSTGGGGSIGGMAPKSILDPAIASQPTPGWSDVLGDAAKR